MSCLAQTTVWNGEDKTAGLWNRLSPKIVDNPDKSGINKSDKCIRFTVTGRQSLFYRPPGAFVGDPMPFFDPVARDFKIMYLYEQRPNPEGTYHPFYGLSTTDAASYIELGQMIQCGAIDDQDAALGTGSTIYDDSLQLYYTFYTANRHNPTDNQDAQVVMYATSKDFKTWQKSQLVLRGNPYFYYKSDFRDPFVFHGDDGTYHMLVSTKKDEKGVIAEFTSADLKSWTSAGVFMTMMWDRFYECPDVFKMGDWWYLVYSEMHSAIRRVQYFKGRTLEELKACTANDAGQWPDSHEGFLDSRGFYAGKTASDGVNRYIWGWCPTRPNYDNTDVGAPPAKPEWAGNLVAHRIIQHEDGTLTLGEVPGIADRFGSGATPEIIGKGGNVDGAGAQWLRLSGDSYVMFPKLAYRNRISFKVKTSDNADNFGLSFMRNVGSTKFYSVVVNSEREDKERKLNFEEQGSDGKGFIAGADSHYFERPADNTYNVTVVTDNSVCAVYINDRCCYTNRIYGTQRNCWTINSYGGTIEVSDVRVASF